MESVLTRHLKQFLFAFFFTLVFLSPLLVIMTAAKYPVAFWTSFSTLGLATALAFVVDNYYAFTNKSRHFPRLQRKVPPPTFPWWQVIVCAAPSVVYAGYFTASLILGFKTFGDRPIL